MKSEMYESMHAIEEGHWYFRAKHDIVLSIIEQAGIKDAKIADFGCGCGLMLKFLSKYGTVTGIDFSSEALEFCRDHFSGDLIQANLEQLSLPEKYNLAVALDLLEHIEHDDIAMKNIYDSLEENALAIFTVPAFSSLWSKHDENCMHKRRYSKEEFQNLVLGAGFSIEYISYYDFWLFPPVYLVRKLAKLFKFDQNSELENKYKDGFVNKTLYKIFSSEKRFVQKRKTMPFGVSIICICRKTL